MGLSLEAAAPSPISVLTRQAMSHGSIIPIRPPENFNDPTRSTVSSQITVLCAFHYLKKAQGYCYLTEILQQRFTGKEEPKLKVLQSVDSNHSSLPLLI